MQEREAAAEKQFREKLRNLHEAAVALRNEISKCLFSSPQQEPEFHDGNRAVEVLECAADGLPTGKNLSSSRLGPIGEGDAVLFLVAITFPTDQDECKGAATENFKCSVRESGSGPRYSVRFDDWPQREDLSIERAADSIIEHLELLYCATSDD